MVRLNFIKKINILSCGFTVVWDKTRDGGSFSWDEALITIGYKTYKTDPLYTLHIINHELMELILVGLGNRYVNGRNDDYLFSFNHQSFENAIKVHTQALSEFIAYSK